MAEVPGRHPPSFLSFRPGQQTVPISSTKTCHLFLPLRDPVMQEIGQLSELRCLATLFLIGRVLVMAALAHMLAMLMVLVSKTSGRGVPVVANHFIVSWDMWPTGANDMNTNEDQGWISALGGKPYMMGISPWFYTNLPQWSKNWAWRGDSLLHDRWQEIYSLQPQFVEVRRSSTCFRSFES